MPLQPPPPPPITPRQMNILRIAASMAWSDGSLAQEEVEIMLDQLSGIFADDAPQQRQLRQELQEYVTQNIPLAELTPKIQTDEDKELVLRLGYEVIRCSSRSPEEDKINEAEAIAYQKLVELLGVSDETVKRVEAAVDQTFNADESMVDGITRHLEDYAQG
ncbi:MAG: TerB family tellurite resistance protein [Synechococcales cyanobacterium K44_A2020_017]|nr:TerB family tellurite resistance protein [Synechococcales cyanobacterium K32_A2020_035]MBF2094479.1 TerB family tellurite resistance protein [Synechococcales cyanobacterium K44_A2020_017]